MNFKFFYENTINLTYNKSKYFINRIPTKSTVIKYNINHSYFF